MRKRTYIPTPEHRAALLRNLGKAWVAPRLKPFRRTRAHREAARANIEKAQAAIRKRGLPATEARRASSLANLAKANAVLRERGYPRSDRQRETARLNLRKAWEVSHNPINYGRIYRSRLKHGLYARRLDELIGLYLDLMMIANP